MDLAAVLASLSERIGHLVYAVVILSLFVAMACLLSAWNAIALRRERELRAKERAEDLARWREVNAKVFPERAGVAVAPPTPPALTSFFDAPRTTSPSPIPEDADDVGRRTVLPSSRRR